MRKPASYARGAQARWERRSQQVGWHAILPFRSFLSDSQRSLRLLYFSLTAEDAEGTEIKRINRWIEIHPTFLSTDFPSPKKNEKAHLLRQRRTGPVGEDIGTHPTVIQSSILIGIQDCHTNHLRRRLLRWAAGEDEALDRLKILLASDDVRFVVPGVFHLVELFRFGRGVEQAASQRVRHHVVRRAVDEQLGAADRRHAIDGVHPRSNQKPGHEGHHLGSHFGNRSETRLDNQSGGLDFSRQVNRDRAAERVTEQDNAIRGDVSLAGQEVPRRARVLVKPPLAGPAFAAPIASIIEDQRIDRNGYQRLDHLIAVGEIAAVAVKPEEGYFRRHRLPRLRGFAPRRAEPAVEFQAVACCQPAIFDVGSNLSLRRDRLGRIPQALRVTNREIDKLFFKPHERQS